MDQEESGFVARYRRELFPQRLFRLRISARKIPRALRRANSLESTFGTRGIHLAASRNASRSASSCSESTLSSPEGMTDTRLGRISSI